MTDVPAETWSFPTDKAQFHDDERISFSKLDGKYIAVQEDGNEVEFDEALKRWVPHEDDVAHEEMVAEQLTTYGSGGDRQVDDGSDANRRAGARPGQKRKDYDREPDNTNGKRKHANPAGDGNSSTTTNKRPRPTQTPKPRQNTAVYVTGLPPDATVDEVAELFSRKCGVIAEEIDSGRPRIKLYTDADGQFKGDALIVFFKPQSVDMATMLLDDTTFRFAAAPDAKRMCVQAADASYKKTTYQGQGQGQGGSGDSSTPAAGPARRGGGNSDKQKIIKKTQKLDAKLADWSSDEERPYGAARGGAGGVRTSKWDKVVVLKHMFTLQELEEDPAALLDIKEDIREECTKLGEVTNVVLFDREAAGVVSVKFKTVAAAAACVQLMDGRAFAGQTVEAALATGREKYSKSSKDSADDEEEADD